MRVHVCLWRGAAHTHSMAGTLSARRSRAAASHRRHKPRAARIKAKVQGAKSHERHKLHRHKNASRSEIKEQRVDASPSERVGRWLPERCRLLSVRRRAPMPMPVPNLYDTFISATALLRISSFGPACPASN
eukprot:scaffold9748_cov93-Isochrysis_galbana.AAC.5